MDEQTEPTRDDAAAAGDTITHDLVIPQPLASAGGRRQRDEIRARLFDVPVVRERIGRYEVLRRLGEGALGVVYACRDAALDREVAVKVMRAATADTARMRREAQAMAQLSDPNVAAVFEVGEHAGQVFIAMELVDGVTLRRWQAQRSVPEILAAYRQAGLGLAAAHRVGIVHRDFKPDNVMVAGDGRVRVLDFGLARTRGVEVVDSVASGDDTIAVALDTTLTTTGITVGTPAYMALEQFHGADVDARADQFSFAVALYEALFRERPFRGGSAGELTQAIRAGRIAPRTDDRGVPERVHRALRRALAADRDGRFARMEDLLAELVTDDRRRRWPALLGGSAIVGALAFAIAGPRADPCEGASAELDAAWSGSVAAQIRDDLQARGAFDAYASARADELDLRAEQWRAEAVAVCNARGDGIERRRACLDDTRIAIATAADRLQGRAAADDVSDASTRIDALPVLSLATCAELRAAGAIPSRTTPEQVVAAMEIRIAIDVAIRAGAAGEYAAASAAVVPAVAMARTIDDPVLLAEALIIEAAVHESTGDPAAAERGDTEAYEVARAAGHDRLALRAATDLVHVVGQSQHRREPAEQWARAGEALALRLPVDDRARARLLINRGLMRSEHGDAAGARVDLEDAIARLAASEGPDNNQQLPALSNLAHLALQENDPSHARELLDRAIEIRERTEGVDHPGLITHLVNRALVSIALDRWADAHADLERAAALCDARGLTSERASVERNLAYLLYEEGDFEAARLQIERAISAFVPMHGAEHERVLSARVMLARVLIEQGELGRARETLLAVSTTAQAGLGDEAELVVEASLILALAEARGGDVDATRRALERASPSRNSPDDQCGGLLWLSLAAELPLGEGGTAIPLATLEQASERAPACALQRAELEFTLARVHAALGHPAAIYRPVALSARQRWLGRGRGWTARADAVDAWLAAHP